MELVIDARETRLIDELKNDKLKDFCSETVFKTTNLETGDVRFIKDGKPKCVIERKSLTDYVESIKTKRLTEQTIRLDALRKENPDILVIILFESGPLTTNQYINGVSRDAIYTSLTNKMLRNKFYLIHSNDISDSALWISKIFTKLPLFLNKRFEYNTNSYCKSTIKTVKKENNNPELCFIQQLCQIPDVSVLTAKSIQKHYKNMPTLIRSYENIIEIEDRQQMLKDIVIKVRSIGEQTSKKIHDYLYN